MIHKIAKSPTKEGLKISLAKYWYTSAEKIEVLENGVITNSGNATNAAWTPLKGGYLAFHQE